MIRAIHVQILSNTVLSMKQFFYSAVLNYFYSAVLNYEHICMVVGSSRVCVAHIMSFDMCANLFWVCEGNTANNLLKEMGLAVGQVCLAVPARIC